MYEQLKTILGDYYLKNHGLGRKHVFDKFVDMGAPKRILNHWLSLLEQNKKLTRKKGGGHVTKIATPSNIQKLKNAFNHRKGCSQKRVAKKLRVIFIFLKVGCNFLNGIYSFLMNFFHYIQTKS